MILFFAQLVYSNPLKQDPCKKLDVFADLLVWYASEEPSCTWATEGSIPEIINEGYYSAAGVTFDWKLGFRTGLNYILDYDQWEAKVYWTYFRTKFEGHTNPNYGGFSEFDGNFINNYVFESGKIQWTLLYNTIDLEIGRKFVIAKAFSLYPFVGIKTSFIHQAINSQWQNFLAAPSAEDLKNNFWGIGPSIGVSSFVELGNLFQFVGDLSSSMMWGSWIIKDRYYNTEGKSFVFNMNNAALGALMMRGFLGIEWATAINNKVRFTSRLGYEVQYWWNQLRIPTVQQLLLHGDLTLQGGVLNCRVDF